MRNIFDEELTNKALHFLMETIAKSYIMLSKDFKFHYYTEVDSNLAILRYEKNIAEKPDEYSPDTNH